MNTTRTLMALAILAVLLVPASTSAQDTDAAAVALQRAIRVELVDGDLQAAIAQYEEIVTRFAAERTVAATALQRLGESYEKLGDPKARTVYERVLRDYADQAEPVAAVRARLASLDVEVPPPTSAMTVREVMRSADEAQPITDPSFDVSGDGRRFVYTAWATGDLAMKNLDTGENRLFYGNDWSTEWFETPVLSPDEARVAFVRYPQTNDGSTRIEVDSVDGGGRETVFDFGEVTNVFIHQWSPDGEDLLIVGQSADRAGFLATVSLRDKTLRRLLTLDWESPRRAEYSPDGRFIAYDSTKDGESKIYLISADGASERVLVDSSGVDDSPVWTPDGRFLLFRSDRSAKWDLYALRMQDGRPVGPEVVVKSSLGEATFLRGVTTTGQLVYFEVVGGRDIGIVERTDQAARTIDVRLLPKVQTTEIKSPSFAPDGARVAYVAGMPGIPRSNLSIRVTDLRGAIVTDILLDSRFSTNDPPRFSPDGTMMALRVYDAGEPRVMVLSAESGTVLKVFSPLEEQGYTRVLGWSPDSRRLYGFVTLQASDRSLLATIDVDTERIVDSTELSPDVWRVSLSPSGEHLLLLMNPNRPGAGELVLHSLADGSEKLLAEGISIRFGWDYDSRHALYEKGALGSEDDRLYSVSINTGEETVLIDDLGPLNLAAVSPDGTYWAFQSRDTDRDSRILVLEHFLPEDEDAARGR